MDVVRVGDPPDLSLGADDPQILLWAEREDRILITEDKNTIASHLANHCHAGRRSPGVFMVRVGCSISQLVALLELVAHAGSPLDYENVITYVP